MPIITLTTDLGDSDYFVGALKGYILSHSPGTTIVDVSHSIPHHDVAEAAFTIANCFRDFPPGTVHLVSADGGGAVGRNVIVRSEGHLFVGPDNGIFSLALTGEVEAFTTNGSHPSTVPALDHLAPLACQIANGRSPEQLGQPSQSIVRLAPLRPSISPEGIRCNVLHVDHFGNAVLNLSLKSFEEARQDRKFAIRLRGNNTVDRIGSSYQDGGEGEVLCLPTRSGLLQIAVTLGRADDLFGLHRGESVRIDFES